MSSKGLFLLSMSTVLLAAPATAEPIDWAQYRGALGNGRYTATSILTSWPDRGLPEQWRTKVGGGYAGVSVAAGKVFTIEQRQKQETVAAYDLASGRELWHSGWPARFSSFMGGKGPRTTPTWDDGKLYAVGALGEFRCLNADTGEVIWRKNILEENGTDRVRWGLASSPLIVDELVIVQPGGRSGRSVVAYSKATGEEVWTALDDKTSYASPMLATLGGVRQIIAMTAEGAVGLNPESGELLWRHPWNTKHDVNAAQPVIIDDGRFLISSGYGHGAALIEISGSAEELTAKALWTNINLKNKFSTSVAHEGHVYGLDEGILTCIDAETGTRRWKGGRYGHGQVLLAGEHLVVTSATGDVVLVSATPEGHRELASFPAVKGKTWNPPALAGGNLIVRNQKEMVCYRIAPE